MLLFFLPGSLFTMLRWPCFLITLFGVPKSENRLKTGKQKRIWEFIPWLCNIFRERFHGIHDLTPTPPSFLIKTKTAAPPAAPRGAAAPRGLALITNLCVLIIFDRFLTPLGQNYRCLLICDCFLINLEQNCWNLLNDCLIVILGISPWPGRTIAGLG